MLGSVGADEIAGRDGDAAALEVDPGVVHAAVGLVHLAECPAEPAAPGPIPVMVEKAVAQLVGEETDQHGPRDLVLPPLAHDVALLDLDRLGVARVHARDPRAEQHPVAPVPDPAHQQQTPHAGEGARDEIAAGGVLTAPGAGVHPVVHAAVAVGTLALEVALLVPRLRAAAPGAVAHRVLHAAAAAPVAAGVHAEAARRLERRLAGVALLVDVRVAPGTVREPVRHDPAAAEALRAGDLVLVLPLLRPAAVGAVGPVLLQLVAADAVVHGSRRVAAAPPSGAHGGPLPRPPAAERTRSNPSPPSAPRWPCRARS